MCGVKAPYIKKMFTAAEVSEQPPLQTPVLLHFAFCAYTAKQIFNMLSRFFHSGPLFGPEKKSNFALDWQNQDNNINILPTINSASR